MTDHQLARWGVPQVLAFPFAFDTPGLAAGVPVFTPNIGDVLLDVWVEIDEAWDGTTPKIDVGDFINDGHGMWFDFDSDPLDATVADANDNLGAASLIYSAQATNGSLRDLAAIGNYNAGTAHTSRFLPAKWISADPIKVAVSEDGTAGGTDPGATQGRAVLYLVVATPVLVDA